MILPFFVQAGLVKLAAISFIPNHYSKNELFLKYCNTTKTQWDPSPPPSRACTTMGDVPGYHSLSGLLEF